MYRLSVEGEFSSAHSLRDYSGKCAKVHGHNWKVRLIVCTDKLDERGMAVDFGNLKALLDEVITPFDHVDLNRVAPFDSLNPTAENLARVIFEKVETKMPAGSEVDKVQVWEYEKNRVEYSRRPAI
jgi:6-pyruvoyltetrahydropterin/6-carboxytetrahydropterin synthase